jgi:hypothetical protein
MNSSIKKLRLLPILVASFLLLAMCFSANTQAAITPSMPNSNPMQLAYHYVHGHPGYYHGSWRPRHYGTYWTGWRPYYWRHGYRCKRSCLINRWNGSVIRCKNRCF